MKAYLAVLIVLGLQTSPLPADDKKEAPKPLPPEVVQAWRDAGANVGWMNMNLHLNRPIFEAEGDHRNPSGWWDRTNAMPVFQFSEWEEGVLVKLPDPGAPFGLCLNLTKMTDAGLKELAGLKNLQALYLAKTPVTDAGLKEFAGRKSLQTLDLGGTKVTDAGLKELSGLESLQSLYLANCPVTDAGLKELAGLKSLQVLNLGDTKVTGAGLADLKSLQALYLYNTAVTDVGLKDLAELKSLQFLDLARCPGVTDAGLKDLGAMKSLKHLRIYLTKVTAAGAAALKKDLPAAGGF